MKCIKFAEGLSHPRLKALSHIYLTEEKRKPTDVTLGDLIDHCNGIIEGSKSLGEKLKYKNCSTPDAADRSRLDDGASGSGTRSKRKSKGRKRPAEEEMTLRSTPRKGKPTGKDGKPLTDAALRRKHEYDSMAKKLGKAKVMTDQ
eukprot:jgi/Tetstr1/455412/TSEL_042244.t1